MARKVGVLDFSKIRPPATAPDAIWDTIALAPEVEAMGYHRYWVTEHHNYDVAHSSPDLLLPVLAGVTERIRVGTAGMLLRFYSPLKVANDFRLLHTVFPERIDLGIARGFASEEVSRKLLEGHPERPFADKVDELLALLRDAGEVEARPPRVVPPEVWILGSSTTSVKLAGRAGTHFCLALFLGRPDKPSEAIVSGYRESFEPSLFAAEPRVGLAVAVACAESRAEAQRLAAEFGPGVTHGAIGTPEDVRDILLELEERHAADELILLDLCLRLRDRVRSYRLIADALAL